MSEHILFHDIDEPGLNTLEVYERRGGYESLRKAMAMQPQQITDELLASNVRGRGGAGFAMGRKVWFMPAGTMDKYLVCNADESEPGTFKDRELITKTPHTLIERVAPAAKAAMMTPSISVCGVFVMSSRSLNVPGSDSSALHTRYLSIVPCRHERDLAAHGEARAAAAADVGTPAARR